MGELNLSGIRRPLQGHYGKIGVARFSSNGVTGPTFLSPKGTELSDLIRQCVPEGCTAGIEKGLFVVSSESESIGILGVPELGNVAHGDFYGTEQKYDKIVFANPTTGELLPEHAMTPKQQRMAGALQESIRQKQYVEPMNEVYGNLEEREKDW